MKYDLHIHTTCSDGKYNRLEILKKANDLDFSYISFTDHNYISDDISQLNEQYIINYQQIQNVKLILATELDIEEYPRLHILGYDFKKIDIMTDILKKLELENTEICKDLINKIYQYYGIEIPFEDLRKMTVNGNVTKNIVVQWLIDNKYAKNVYDAGMKFTSKYSPCYVKKSTLKLDKAFSLIKQSEGLIVMAHPASLKLPNDKLFEFIISLKEKGLDGIEVFNADKTNKEQLKCYREIAKRLNLLETSGSDFHRETETSIFGVSNNLSDKFIKTLQRRK